MTTFFGAKLNLQSFPWLEWFFSVSLIFPGMKIGKENARFFLIFRSSGSIFNHFYKKAVSIQAHDYTLFSPTDTLGTRYLQEAVKVDGVCKLIKWFLTWLGSGLLFVTRLFVHLSVCVAREVLQKTLESHINERTDAARGGKTTEKQVIFTSPSRNVFAETVVITGRLTFIYQ